MMSIDMMNAKVKELRELRRPVHEADHRPPVCAGMRKAPCITRQDDCKRPTPTQGAGKLSIAPAPAEITEEHMEESGELNFELSGHTFPVAKVLHIEGQSVPLLNIRMMSDERERELAWKGARA